MLSAIVAVDENFGIGFNNDMLFFISEDLKRFKSITLNKKIVMGRKTFESLPKVLPSREHIVITKNKNYNAPDGVVLLNDTKEVIDKYKFSEEEVFVIGGGQIYKETIESVKKIYLTCIHSGLEADTFFPKFDKSQFNLIEKSETYKDEKTDIYFHYETYERV